VSKRVVEEPPERGSIWKQDGEMKEAKMSVRSGPRAWMLAKQHEGSPVCRNTKNDFPIRPAQHAQPEDRLVIGYRPRQTAHLKMDGAEADRGRQPEPLPPGAGLLPESARRVGPLAVRPRGWRKTMGFERHREPPATHVPIDDRRVPFYST
jgi:hypothetical protein